MMTGIICVGVAFFILGALVVAHLADKNPSKHKIISQDTRIAITFCPLSENKDEIFKMSKNDQMLIDAIVQKSIELHQQQIETFERRENIIVTEKGYYMAFFVKDLVKIPG
jgi:hypothetical protein